MNCTFINRQYQKPIFEWRLLNKRVLFQNYPFLKPLWNWSHSHVWHRSCPYYVARLYPGTSSFSSWRMFSTEKINAWEIKFVTFSVGCEFNWILYLLAFSIWVQRDQPLPPALAHCKIRLPLLLKAWTIRSQELCIIPKCRTIASP